MQLNTSSSAQHISCTLNEGRVAVNINVGGITDSGMSSKQNQDDYFIITSGNHIAIGVLDGHGRELGLLASNTAKQYFLSQFEKPGFFEQLEQNPENVIRYLYKCGHDAIQKAFYSYYLQRGHNVQFVQPGNYLVKQSHFTQSFTCVHGGTTATIIVILHGKRIISSNVGDSTAFLGGIPVRNELLRPLHDHGPIPGTNCSQSWNSKASDPNEDCNTQMKQNKNNETKQKGKIQSNQNDNIQMSQDHVEWDKRSRGNFHHDHKLLTSDHSPENQVEFRRVRAFRPSLKNSSLPELLFLYDSVSISKVERDCIFRMREGDKIEKSKQGKYYKNVRNEWATLVTTPTHARFQDSLAFTRSLGDFHLHTYGVSHEPDIFEINIEDLQIHREFDNGKFVALVLLAATDGIWDNWKYEDLSNYLLESKRLKVLKEKGIEYVLKEFVSLNTIYAVEHFSNQIDNMTAVACYIHLNVVNSE